MMTMVMTSLLKGKHVNDSTEDDKDTDDDKEDDDDITDDDNDDDDNYYVPNKNMELDFSDNEEFLAELSDCSDEVIELTSKVKSKRAKGGGQRYGGKPTLSDRSQTT